MSEETEGKKLIPVTLEKSAIGFCTNAGAVPLMGINEHGARLRVGVIDCQSDFKRGKGHEAVCARRDAILTAIIARYNTQPDLLEALEPFAKAADAYVAAYQGFAVEGETLADRTASERERDATAMEAAFDALGSLTFEQLAAARSAITKAKAGA